MKKLSIPRLTALTGLLAAIFFLVVMAVQPLVAQPVAAQTPAAHHITGKIIAQSSGVPIPGASVTVKGTKNTVQADLDGSFSIMAAPNEVLVISSVGYANREIKVGNAQTVTAELIQDYNNLNDVIVVGYGRMKKSDLSSAVGTISSTDLEKTVNVTLDEALQGKAANVYVQQASGQPGAGASVIIRGVSTVTGNYQPLYVIDGVQIRPSTPTGGQYNSTPQLANELQGLNPDDIENISVLEGPAATSIYGAAGANGVLMITTKQGKAGNTRVTATELQSLQDRPKNQPVMNLPEYAVYVQKLENLGLVPAEPSELSDPSILGPGTDWQHALFQNTWMQKHSVGLSGGSDKTTFYFSTDYLNQNGIAIGSGFERASTRFNLTNQATKWLRFNTTLSLFGTKEKVNVFQGQIVNQALTQNPTIPVYNPDGSFGGPSAAEVQYSNTNPIAVAKLDNNYNTSFGAIGGLSMDITPFKGLTWHTEGNGNYTFGQGYTFNPSYTIPRRLCQTPTRRAAGPAPTTTGLPSIHASNMTGYSVNTICRSWPATRGSSTLIRVSLPTARAIRPIRSRSSASSALWSPCLPVPAATARRNPILPAAITRMTTSISRSWSSAATAAPTSVPIIAGVPFLRLRRPGRSPMRRS